MKYVIYISSLITYWVIGVVKCCFNTNTIVLNKIYFFI